MVLMNTELDAIMMQIRMSTYCDFCKKKYAAYKISEQYINLVDNAKKNVFKDYSFVMKIKHLGQ